MMLTNEQMNTIIEYLQECYDKFYNELIIEDKYIFIPEIEFIRDENGNWIPN